MVRPFSPERSCVLQSIPWWVFAFLSFIREYSAFSSNSLLTSISMPNSAYYVICHISKVLGSKCICLHNQFSTMNLLAVWKDRTLKKLTIFHGELPYSATSMMHNLAFTQVKLYQRPGYHYYGNSTNFWNRWLVPRNNKTLLSRQVFRHWWSNDKGLSLLPAIPL